MKQNIGEIICQYRQNRKMTQEEFASRLGVTPQAVSRWERGNGLPDVSLIEGICRILNVSANILLGIDDSKVIENGNLMSEQEIKNNMVAEPFMIEFGEEIISCIAAGLKTDYVNQKRKELVQRTGMLMPLLRLRDNIGLEKNKYRIVAYDQVLFEGYISSDDENSYKDIIDQATKECEAHYDQIMNKQLVKAMIDNVKELYPGIADGLIPERISYLQVERKLQEILRQGGSLRDLIHILEELEDNL